MSDKPTKKKKSKTNDSTSKDKKKIKKTKSSNKLSKVDNKKKKSKLPAVQEGHNVEKRESKELDNSSIEKPKIVMLDDEEINRRLDILLDSRGVTESKKKDFYGMAMEGKRAFVVRFWDDLSESENVGEVPGKELTAMKAVKAMMTEPTVKLVKKMKLEITDPAWVDDFIEVSGVDVIVTALMKLEENRTDKGDVQNEVVQLLVALLPMSEIPIDIIFEKQETVNNLVSLITSSEPVVKLKVLQIIAVICSLNDDVSKILLALDTFAYQNKQAKYEQLVMGLRHDKSVETKVIIFTLINTMINVPEELADRIRIRSDIYAVGFEHVLSHLQGLPNLSPDLETQIEVFLEDQDQDEEEFHIDLENLESKYGNLNLDDPSELFKALNSHIAKGSNIMKYFIGILRHLLIMPVDKNLGFKLWFSIERFVQQISTSRNQIYVDTSTAISLAELLEQLDDTARLEDELQENYLLISQLEDEVKELTQKTKKSSEITKNFDGVLKKEAAKIKQKYVQQIQDKDKELDTLELELDELEGKLKKKIKAIDTKDKQVKVLIEKFNEDMRKKVRENTQLQEKLEKAGDFSDTDIQKLKVNFDHEKAQYTQQISQLQDAVSEREKEIRTLKSEKLDEEKNKIDLMQEDLENRYQTSLEKLKEEHAEKLSAINQKHQDTLTRTIEQQKEEFEASLSQNAQTAQQNDDTLERLKEKNKEINTLKQELDQLEANLEESKSLVRSKEHELEILREEHAEEKDKAGKKLAIYEDTITELENNLKESRSRNTELLAELESSEMMWADKVEKLQRITDDMIKDHAFDIEELENVLGSRNETIKLLNAEITEKGDFTNEEFDLLEEKLKALSEKNNILTAEIRALEDKSENLDDVILTRIEEETKLLKIELIKKDKKIENEEKKFNDLLEKMDEQKNSYEFSRVDIAEELIQLRIQCTNLEGKNYELEEKLKMSGSSKSSGSLGNFMSQINDLRKENEEFEKDIVHLQKELHSYKLKNEKAIKNIEDVTTEKNTISEEYNLLLIKFDEAKQRKLEAEKELEETIDLLTEADNELKEKEEMQLWIDDLQWEVDHLKEKLGIAPGEEYSDPEDNTNPGTTDPVQVDDNDSLDSFKKEKDLLTLELSTVKASLERKIETLNGQLEKNTLKSKQEIEDLTEELKKLKTRAKLADEKDDELNDLKRRFELGKTKIELLSEEKSIAENEITELNTVIEDLTEGKTTLISRIEDLTDRIQELSDANDVGLALQKRISELEIESQNLSNTKEDLTRNVALLTENNSNLKERVSDLSRLESIVPRLESQVVDLQKKIRENSNGNDLVHVQKESTTDEYLEPISITEQYFASTTPRFPLNNFNWSKVDDTSMAIFSTFTDTIDIDIAKLEAKFSASDAPNIPDDTYLNEDEPGNNVLDHSKQMRVRKFISIYGKDAEEIYDAIYMMDEEVLTVPLLNHLSEICPDSAEADLLQNTADLSSSNQFLLKLSTIDNLQERIFCQKFVNNYTTIKTDLRKPLLTYRNAILDMTTKGRNFDKFLEIVLAVGNVVNSGSYKGNAKGFSVSSLALLRDTKMTGPEQKTLLNYILNHITEKDPSVLKLSADLKVAKFASKYSFQIIRKDISRIRAFLSKVEEVFPSVPQSPNYENDVFYLKMPTLVSDCRESFSKELENILVQCESDFSDLLIKYGESPNTTPAEFFSTISAFVSSLDAARSNKKTTKAPAPKQQSQPPAPKQKQPRIEVTEIEIPTISTGRSKSRRGKGRAGLTRGHTEYIPMPNGDLFDNLKSGAKMERKRIQRKNTLSAKKKQNEDNS